MAALARQPEMEEEEDEASEEKREQSKGLTDTEILSLLAAEKQHSIGFENGTELERKRRQSLEYSKGVMSDVPSLPNRSKATSSDIIDAIETVMPDLMEIFTGGEDVATFAPRGQEDEPGAQQETDYVNYVAFQKLPGFRLLYTAIKDALQVDTGVLKTWWEDNEADEEEKLEGVTALQIQAAVEGGAKLVSSEPLPVAETMPMAPADEMGEGAAPDPTGPVPLFNATLTRTYDKGCIKSAAVDPMNLTVSQDTVDLDTSPYCAIRSFPRAQDLLDRGFDPDKVALLKGQQPRSNDETVDQARDQAGETTAVSQSDGGSSGEPDADGKSLMRTVEIHEHWVRSDLEGEGKSQLWHIITDSDCKIILLKKEVDRRGLAAGTPFMTTHRFYGTSLAEKLVEVQKIKTALLRMMLDSGYFAMNQRVQVSDKGSNKNTLADLMRNEPGMPIRVAEIGAVAPVQAGQLGFDPQMALEYVSTMGEQRTGVVRNAQGLNPDTLHDTAKGAMALMTMAQKRIRMIARVLAETLVKGWFLDIHALSRKHATRAEKIRLRGKWVDVDPSNFGDRADMVIEVGVGSGGKDQELAIITKMLEMQKETMVESQGQAPILDWTNIYNTWKRWIERAGLKAPELYIKDPGPAMEEAKANPQPPPPDPKMVEIEMKAKAKEAEMAMDAQQKQQQAQIDAAQQAAQAERDAQFKREEMMLTAQLKREEMAGQLQLRREQMQAELGLKREQLQAELQMNMELEMAKINAGVYAPAAKPNGGGTSEVHMGGEAGA